MGHKEAVVAGVLSCHCVGCRRQMTGESGLVGGAN